MNDVKGNCIGVQFVPRGEKDNHICIKLLIEDDENWNETDVCVSSFWIDDMITVLKEAKERLQNEAKPDGKWGYKFKGNKM